jgi:hypothetical protein
LKTHANAWLRFQVPESVLPIDLGEAVVTLSIRAPSRVVEILAMESEEPIVTKKLVHPIGTYRSVLKGRDSLRLDDGGGLLIGIRVGEDESAEVANIMDQAAWQVQSLQMEIRGRVRGQ